MVPLELDDLAELVVLDEGAVAGEFLLEGLQDLLWVILVGDPLERGERLAPVALLDPDVHVVGLGDRLLVERSVLVADVGEWVCPVMSLASDDGSWRERCAPRLARF